MAGSPRRTLLNVLIASLTIAAFVAIVALLGGEPDETTGRIVVTFFAVSLYSATSLGGLTAAAHPQSRRLATAIWAFSGAGLLVAVLAIWDSAESEELQRLAWAAAVAAVSAAHVGLIAARGRGNDTRAIRIGETLTCACVLLLAGLAVRAIASDVDDESYFRLLGVVAILDAYGTFAIPLIRVLRAEPRPSAARRSFPLALVALLTAAAAAGILGLVRSTVDEDLGRMLATLPFVALFAATAQAGVVVRRLPGHDLLGGLTVTVSGCALVAMLNVIWVSDFSFEGGGEADFEWAWTLFVAAGTLAHICVLLARRRPGDSPRTLMLVPWAVVAAIAAGLTLVYPVFADDAGADFAVWLAIVLILDTLASTLVALVRKRDSATA
jgi:hypothetical protein